MTNLSQYWVSINKSLKMRNLITKYSLILHPRNQQYDHSNTCSLEKSEQSTEHKLSQSWLLVLSHLFFNGLFLCDASPFHHNLNFKLLFVYSMSSEILAMSCFCTGIFPHFYGYILSWFCISLVFIMNSKPLLI